MNKPLIPFFGTRQEYAAHAAEIVKAVKSVFASGRHLQGPAVEELEHRMARAAHRAFGVAVNSCTDALYYSLLAAGVGAGDDVLVTDFSFIASASCIARAGARPVFIDIGEDFNIDLTKASAFLTPKTKALIAVHLYGQMINPEVLQAFCEQHHLALIEDAAQALDRDGAPRASPGYL